MEQVDISLKAYDVANCFVRIACGGMSSSVLGVSYTLRVSASSMCRKSGLMLLPAECVIAACFKGCRRTRPGAYRIPVFIRDVFSLFLEKFLSHTCHVLRA